MPCALTLNLMPDYSQLDESLRALNDPTRRRVVELLGAGAQRAGELATSAGVTPPVMSRHLRVLLAAGLVDDERSVTDARVRLFFLCREPLTVVGSWIERVLSEAPWEDDS